MGFLDILTGGGRKLKQPAPDRLFAMSTAAITMELQLNLASSGRAAIVFQPLATSDFDSVVAEMEDILHGIGGDVGTSVEKSDDTFGYRWMIIADEDFEDLVVGINGVSSALIAGGYGDRVLCAVFSFRDQGGKPVFWIYNYKRGAFYPFCPSGGTQQRDTERELRLKAQLGGEIPFEEDTSRWFPLWEIPL